MDSLDRATLGVWRRVVQKNCKKNFGSFFLSTSNVNFSETVYPNNLKFNLERNPIKDYSHLKFQVIRTNRDIEFWKLAEKPTDKNGNLRAVFASSRTKAVTSVNIKVCIGAS